MADFDPYHKWLGIPPRDQPPHHYRLLGVDLFESDPDVISGAAERHVTYLQNVGAGPNAEASQRLLSEVNAAKLCLLSIELRSAYDVELRARLAALEPKAAAALPVATVIVEPEPAPTPVIVESVQQQPATTVPPQPDPAPFTFLNTSPVSKPNGAEKPAAKPAAKSVAKPDAATASKPAAAAQGKAAGKEPAGKQPAKKKGPALDQKILIRWAIIAVVVMVLAAVAGVLTSGGGGKKPTKPGATKKADGTKKPKK